MTKKRKVGIFMLLIGFGIPSVLFFFQGRTGSLLEYKFQEKTVKRSLTKTELERIDWIRDSAAFWYEYHTKRDEAKKKLFEFIQEYLEPYIKEENKVAEYEIRTSSKINVPYEYSVGLGVALFLIGIGFFLFSFFPKAHMEEDKKESQTD